MIYFNIWGNKKNYPIIIYRYSSVILKVLITAAADNSFNFCLCVYFYKKISLGISCESSANQMIHMKCQVIFSLQNDLKNWNVVCYNSAEHFKG